MKTFAAVVGICALFSGDLNMSASLTVDPDTRSERLEAFFRSYGCPAPFHVEEYLSEADANAIDYRLLPALSVRESTCGWYARGNNRWGWDSARTDFESVTHGIHFLARELSSGPRYRGKSLKQKLNTYNSRPQYARQVQNLMRQVESDGGVETLMSGCRQPEYATPDPHGSTGAGDAPSASDPPQPGPPHASSRIPPCPFR